MQIKIYALVNPISNAPFYVGATMHDLSSRKNAKGNIEKQRHIPFIRSRGSEHEIVMLDSVHHSEAQFWEEFYMQLFSSWGFPLANKRKSDYTQRYSDWAADTDDLHKTMNN